MNNGKHPVFDMAIEDLADIETALRENLNPRLGLVSEIAGHLLYSGGKRLRPLLMVLCARICGYEGDYDKTFSTIFEYLHVATLLHDDLVDDAVLRRGQPVAHSIWGNSVSVLVGDFLLARALSIAAETEHPKIIKIIARTTEEMSQGEIDQLIKKGNIDLSEEEYMEVIRCKTAVLFEGACRVSALIADAPEKEEKALSQYGFNLGVAFQMADDLLDYTSETSVLGKEVGADLKEGKLTLPVIYSLRQADLQDRIQMEAIIKNKDFSGHNFQILLEMLNKYGGIAYTQNLAAAHIDSAKEALRIFKPSETRDLLMDVANYTLARKT